MATSKWYASYLLSEGSTKPFDAKTAPRDKPRRHNVPVKGGVNKQKSVSMQPMIEGHPRDKGGFRKYAGADADTSLAFLIRACFESIDGHRCHQSIAKAMRTFSKDTIKDFFVQFAMEDDITPAQIDNAIESAERMYISHDPDTSGFERLNM